jgi:uncharacterized protein involved in response to NO
VLLAEGAATGGLLLLAGGFQLVRVARWGGRRTFAEPLITVLHVGYLWLGIGLLLLGLDAGNEIVMGGPGLHAITVGAFGTMILAVMTRATRGHTGREVTADAVTITMYALVTVAALTRLLAPVLPDLYLTLLGAAAFGWLGAFGLFLIAYGPMLCLARPDGRPG